MDECRHAMEELRNIVEGISNLRDTAYAHYSLLVEQVLKDQITDERQLEQIMDGLCDFCDEIRFIDLYRSLCRHIYAVSVSSPSINSMQASLCSTLAKRASFSWQVPSYILSDINRSIKAVFSAMYSDVFL